MKRLAAIVATLALLSGCGDSVGFDDIYVEDSISDSVAFLPNESIPAQHEENVPIATRIHLKFSGPVNPASAQDLAFFRVEDDNGAIVPGKIEFGSDYREIFFTPTTGGIAYGWDTGVTYTVIGDFLKSTSGRIGPFRRTFTTTDLVQSTGRFKVLAVLPNTRCVAANSSIIAEFSEPMNLTDFKCSTTNFADIFQILDATVGTLGITTKGIPGIVCPICPNNDCRFLEFRPVDNAGNPTIFPVNYLSAVYVKILPSPNLKGLASKESMTAPYKELKVISSSCMY